MRFDFYIRLSTIHVLFYFEYKKVIKTLEKGLNLIKAKKNPETKLIK